MTPAYIVFTIGIGICSLAFPCFVRSIIHDGEGDHEASAKYGNLGFRALALGIPLIAVATTILLGISHGLI